MDARRKPLTPQKIHDAGIPAEYGPILSPDQLGELTGVPRATVYEWIRKGFLDGCFRKRRKRILIWRDSALLELFNGPDWKDKEEDGD